MVCFGKTAGFVLGLVSIIAAGCATDEDVETIETAARVCAAGPTLKGIDVSYYQGTINWAKVKSDGVKFAFIRVSDGLANVDSKFATNWAGARAAGVTRGAYQFFRPQLDAVAQADLFISKVGTLAPDDLPPVIDVEATGNQSAATIKAKVATWIAKVKAATGKEPIIYTGYYFWRDMVGDARFPDNPLWVAAYVNHCPDIPSGWDSWHFWQTTDRGAVAGITGNVDMNTYNGDEASLLAFAGAPATCGDNRCEGDETTETCAVDCPPCGVIAASGGIVDDGDACFVGGGNQMFLRKVTNAGNEGDLVWTYGTDSATEANFAQWNLYLAEAGKYKVEVYTDAGYAKTKKAKYRVKAKGMETTVMLDQTTANGWQSLGEFEFAVAGNQFVHLGDNTGDPAANKVQIALDGVRLTRLDPPEPEPEPEPEPGDPKDDGGCCQSQGRGPNLAALLLVGLALIRRRRVAL